MRKIFLTALVAVSMVTGAFASGPINVNTMVKNHFQQDFARAEEVEWSKSDSYVTATFLSDGKRMKAYYESNGTLIGTSSAVTIDELPLKVKKQFAKKYSEYTVKEAIKFQQDNDIAYFISVENEGRSTILKVTNLQISVHK